MLVVARIVGLGGLPVTVTLRAGLIAVGVEDGALQWAVVPLPDALVTVVGAADEAFVGCIECGAFQVFHQLALGLTIRDRRKPATALLAFGVGIHGCDVAGVTILNVPTDLMSVGE